MTRTSPGRSAPATICSPKASMVPPPTTVGVPVTVPTGSQSPAMGATWRSSTPMAASASVSHRPPAHSEPKEVAVTMSMAGTPLRAWVATAWAGQ